MPRGKWQSVVSARVPSDVKRKLELLAEHKGVNLSEFLRWTLIEYATQHSTDDTKRSSPGGQATGK